MDLETKKMLEERTKKAVLAYRDFSCIDSTFVITKEHIDKNWWALNEACCKYNYRPNLLIEELLKNEF